ncbi:MAG: hypothetical protein ACLRWF_10055 [Ruthenibacterium sp.]
MRIKHLRWLGGGPQARARVCEPRRRRQLHTVAACLQTYGYSANAPYSGACYDLPPGGMCTGGARAAPGGAGTRRTGAAQAELEHTVQALLAFARTAAGRPNKELKRMAKQAAALLGEWQKDAP